MYSRRLSWPICPNAYSILLGELRRDGAALLDLTSSNPTLSGFDYPHQQIAAALGRIQSFEYRPESLGDFPAREAVRRYYLSRNLDVACRRILLTASTSEAYGYLFKLLCNPADDVLVPVPSYPLFEYLAELESVKVGQYRLQYDGSWHIDFAELASRISERTKAIVVVNPNNPTGSFLKDDETDRLFNLASKRNLALIADEVFFDYPLTESTARIPTFVNRCDTLSFSLNGLSKAAGMPQMKLGWMVVNGPESEIAAAMERMELIADTYLSVNVAVQRALPELFAIGDDFRQQIHRRVRSNFAAVQKKLTGWPVHPLHTEGGWCVILQLPRTQSDEEWIRKLLVEHRLMVQPGYFFDLSSEAQIVISLLTRTADLEEGLTRIVHAANG